MVLLEYERKFGFCLTRLPKFMANQGSPAFRHLKHRATVVFEDTYYDTADILSTNNLWVRRRDRQWEAKRQIAGNYSWSTSEEILDTNRIHTLVKQHFPNAPGVEANFGLGILCRFETTRQEFLADEKFTVALDRTDFGHAVGEVEIMTDDNSNTQEEIDSFLTRYSWFFDKGKPKGKLTAYFEKFGIQGS